jgi:hypothetical protein
MNVRANGEAGRATNEDDRVAILHGTASEIKLDESPKQRRQRISRTIADLDALLATTEEEAEEQRETWRLLKQALDEHRPSHAKLFPDE